MNNSNEFKPLIDATITDGIQKFRPEDRVIKDRKVKLNEIVKIGIDESECVSDSSESILPVIEDGCVVGVICSCTCGNSTEIRFDYEVKN